eukprot:gene26300-17393_t
MHLSAMRGVTPVTRNCRKAVTARNVGASGRVLRAPIKNMAQKSVCMSALTDECAVELEELTNIQKVVVLSEALPLLQKFRGKTIVVKYGGAAMKDPSLKAGVISDIVLLSTVGIRVVLVHGGGPEINSWLAKVGIVPEFKNGLRVTDGPTMDIVEMVLGGRVNKSLVSLIQQAGGLAMTEAKIGFVGEVTKVDPTILQLLVKDGYVPVVATIATDGIVDQALNINADIAAGEIAAALKAEKLILMTDVPGVLRDKDDVETKMRSLQIRDCRNLIAEGIIAGGMIPKIDCCIRALSQGVGATHIIDGRSRHSILMELLTNEGVGTMITG